MAMEWELKYRADRQNLEAIRAVVPGQESRYTMQTVYYDTPDASLSARHYTLRRRMENEQSVCTLKFPTEGEGRGEIEIAQDRLELALPELCKLSGLADLPALLEKGLVEVCGAQFTRISKRITVEDTTAELSLDWGILTGGGRQSPLCEVELELKAGNWEMVKYWGAQISAAFGLKPEPCSKFRRAFALAKGE